VIVTEEEEGAFTQPPVPLTATTTVTRTDSSVIVTQTTVYQLPELHVCYVCQEEIIPKEQQCGFACGRHFTHGGCLMEMFIANQEDTVCGLCRAPQTVFAGVAPMGRFRPENVIDPEAENVDPTPEEDSDDDFEMTITRSGNTQLRALGLPLNPPHNINAAVIVRAEDDAVRPSQRARLLTNEEAVSLGLPVDGLPGGREWRMRHI
jgi:hypothetical protein